MASIAVVGSVACDEVVRLVSPLRPGAHLDGTRVGTRLGGGGANVAVALAAAGHRTTLVAAVGRDADGDRMLDALAGAGVDVRAVVRVDAPTTRSLILVDPDGERTVVNVARCDEAAPPRRLLDLAVDAVYVRSRRLDLAPLLARKASACLVVAHMPPVVPGARPAQVMVASAADLAPDALRAPLALGAAVGGAHARWTVVTDGAAGATAYAADVTIAVPAARVPAVDTTGAGDAFAAGLVHALAGGCPMAEALPLAVRFGTEATRHPGSALPAAAVRRLLASPNPPIDAPRGG